MTGKEYKELEIRLWHAWADNDAEAWSEETPNFANLTKLQKERLDRVIESMIQNGGIERFEALTNTKEETETEEPKSGDVVEIDGNEYEVTAVENYGFFVKGRDYIVPFSDEYKIVGDSITEETAPAEVNSDEIESKEEDRPRIRVSYWSDDTLTEVVQKTVVGHITFCDNKATFEEAGRLVVIPCRLLILIQALDR